MHVQHFAEQLLFGTQLADKLCKPKGLIVSHGYKGALGTPAVPGRPSGLQFLPKSDRHAFPSVQNIQDPLVRGRILHFFANHELLAIELMALALIKFPNTPPTFKKEIIALLSQEQNHLQLYIQRMSELGVSFGDVPVNDFFWRTISPVDTPLKYVTHLNLGFEQANLDFALYYEKLFTEVGDTVTASLMRRVYLEEIGHVAHGVRWFDTWRDESQTEWQSFCSHLRLPFSPSRAKGIGFDFDGRRKAGLSEDYIQSLHHFKKHAKVYWFNPSCEQEILSGHPHFTPPLPRQQFAEDFGWCVSYLAESGDSILMQQPPKQGYLEKHKSFGFSVPHVVSKVTSSMDFNPQPWGWSPVSKRVLRMDEDKIFIDKIMSVKMFHEFYDANINLMPELGPRYLLPKLVGSYEELESHLISDPAAYVVKLPAHSGGQGNLLLTSPVLGERERLWIQKAFRDFSTIVLEPWLERICDWGQQLYIYDNGAGYKGLSRYETYASGQLQAYLLGDPQMLLSREVRRAINGPQTYFSILKKTREFITRELMGLGYEGPAGVDAFVFRHKGDFFLRPLVEINSRHTFGHVALAIEKHLARGSLARWQFMNLKQLPAEFSNFQEFAVSMERKFPVVMRDEKIESGFVFTNDPSLARQYLGVMRVFLNKDIESIHPGFTLA